jgi:hypothetical protein
MLRSLRLRRKTRGGGVPKTKDYSGLLLRKVFRLWRKTLSAGDEIADNFVIP